MSDPYRGVVNLDIRDSTPDWAPFSQPVAPPGTPNVVYIVLDDVGVESDRSELHDLAAEEPDRLSELIGLWFYEAGVNLAGEGLTVGRDSGEAVTDDYPGEAPWPFTGGTLHRVAVGVSGTPYVDLEREAAAMLSRE